MILDVDLSIPGWMNHRELLILAKVASLMPPNSHLLEIGAFVGRSTNAFLKNIPNSVSLHVVDRWKAKYKDHLVFSDLSLSKLSGSEENLEYLKSTIRSRPNQDYFFLFEKFTNILDPRLHTYACDTKNFNPTFTPSAVFIDAGHSFDLVDYDIKKYANQNCLLFGHDYVSHRWPEVVEAVNQNRDNMTLLVVSNTSIWFLIPHGSDWFKTILSNIAFH